MVNQPFNVILGPNTELHPGVHGSLIQCPPEGVSYSRARYSYHYVYEGEETPEFSPFHRFSVCEAVEFELPRGAGILIHSSRVPVVNVTPWLVDADCLLATLKYGHFYMIGNGTKLGQTASDNTRLRQTLMLRRYLSPACKAILFRSAHYRKALVDHLRQQALLSEDFLDRLIGKTSVMYPALPLNVADRKEAEVITILYAGWSWEDKGGDIALDLFSAIHEKFGSQLRLVYVGPLPPGRDGPPGTTVVPWMNRFQYLDLLKQCDIFVSPTHFESYGAALIEAASSGAAIVTTNGPGMTHIHELLEADINALFVSNALTREEKTAAFVRLTSALIGNPSLLAGIRSNNRQLFVSGRLSLAKRDQTLLSCYDKLRRGLTPEETAEAMRDTAGIREQFVLRSAILSDTVCERSYRVRGEQSPKRVHAG